MPRLLLVLLIKHSPSRIACSLLIMFFSNRCRSAQFNFFVWTGLSCMFNHTFRRLLERFLRTSIYITCKWFRVSLDRSSDIRNLLERLLHGKTESEQMTLRNLCTYRTTRIFNHNLLRAIKTWILKSTTFSNVMNL